jgi:hypothetical protein
LKKGDPAFERSAQLLEQLGGISAIGRDGIQSSNLHV